MSISKTKPQNNKGQEWTSSDIKKIRDLSEKNTPTRLIALELGRTPSAVQTKASNEHISLKPTNQSPYNRRVK